MDPVELQKVINARVSPAELVNWARYQVCPQCNQIMSGKAKKLKRISENLWIHRSCFDPFVRTAVQNAARRAAKTADSDGSVENVEAP